MWKFGASIKIVTYKLQTILKEPIYYETTISMAFHGNKLRDINENINMKKIVHRSKTFFQHAPKRILF